MTDLSALEARFKRMARHLLDLGEDLQAALNGQPLPVRARAVIRRNGQRGPLEWKTQPATPERLAEVLATQDKRDRLTQARGEVLLRTWLDPQVTAMAIIAELNALPGDRLSADTDPALKRWAVKLGLPRQRPANFPAWSAERRALLRDLWPSATPTADILAQLNALPGRPLLTIQLARQAHHQGMRRARDGAGRAARRARLAAQAVESAAEAPAPEPQAEPEPAPAPAPAAARAPGHVAEPRKMVAPPPAKPAPAPTPAAPAKPEPPKLTREERAMQLLRKGTAEHIVHMQTQVPLRELFRFQAEIRAERRQEQPHG